MNPLLRIELAQHPKCPFFTSEWIAAMLKNIQLFLPLTPYAEYIQSQQNFAIWDKAHAMHINLS